MPREGEAQPAADDILDTQSVTTTDKTTTDKATTDKAHLFTLDLLAAMIALVSYGSAVGLIFNHQTCRVSPSSAPSAFAKMLAVTGAIVGVLNTTGAVFSVGRAVASHVTKDRGNYTVDRQRFWGTGRFPYALLAIILSLAAMVQASEKDCPDSCDRVDQTDGWLYGHALFAGAVGFMCLADIRGTLRDLSRVLHGLVGLIAVVGSVVVFVVTAVLTLPLRLLLPRIGRLTDTTLTLVATTFQRNVLGSARSFSADTAGLFAVGSAALFGLTPALVAAFDPGAAPCRDSVTKWKVRDVGTAALACVATAAFLHFTGFVLNSRCRDHKQRVMNTFNLPAEYGPSARVDKIISELTNLKPSQIPANANLTVDKAERLLHHARMKDKLANLVLHPMGLVALSFGVVAPSVAIFRATNDEDNACDGICDRRVLRYGTTCSAGAAIGLVLFSILYYQWFGFRSYADIPDVTVQQVQQPAQQVQQPAQQVQQPAQPVQQPVQPADPVPMAAVVSQQPS